MTTSPDSELVGIELRYALTITLVEHGRTMIVAELARSLHRYGFTIRGRPGKVIADSLRWEIRRGRVVRVGRGRYRAGTMPRSTRSRLRQRVLARRRQLPPTDPGLAA